MNWFARLKISYKLSVMVASITILFSLLAGIVIWQSISEIMRQDLEARGGAIANEIAVLSSDPIQTENLLALDELIYLSKNNNPFIEYIFIIDTDQQIMAHTFTNGIPKNLLAIHQPTSTGTQSANIISFHSDHGYIHDILQPIEDSSLGYVRIGINENSLAVLLQHKFLLLFFVTLLVGLLGALLVFKITKTFTKPLNKLIHRAETISHGIFTRPPLYIRSGDEFGRLTEAVNIMAKHLHAGEIERKHLLEHLFTAQEDERKRISLELHDESGQALTALMLSMRALANQSTDQETKKYILTVRDETAQILKKLRNLAVELHPSALDELGIEAALKNLIINYQKYHSLQIDFSCALNRQPDNITSLTLYRIVQECLTNIVKHSKASKVLIKLTDNKEVFQMIIKDNGIGITQEDIQKARQTNHLGIYGMQERVRILDGSIEIRSEKPLWQTVYEINIADKRSRTR